MAQLSAVKSISRTRRMPCGFLYGNQRIALPSVRCNVPDISRRTADSSSSGTMVRLQAVSSAAVVSVSRSERAGR